MSQRRRTSKPCEAHIAPSAPLPPTLAAETPLLIRLEREVMEEFGPTMQQRLMEKIETIDASLGGSPPKCPCCGRTMKSKGRRNSSFISRFGPIKLRPVTYRCETCRQHERPLWKVLGVEAGRISGSLARLLALLGVVVPYELAAKLAFLFFGVEVSPMTVWRSVQRLGAACEQLTEQSACFHASANTEHPLAAEAPEVVVLGVDGCALGMQVHTTRRRCPPGQTLPPLPPVEEGHFREVKTGVLLLPAERVEVSPGRHSVLRRVLVTCLGDADRIFDRLWAKLNEVGWLGPKTVVVVVGDGAEWIWNRAKLFVNRCEILDFWHAIERAWEFARLRHGSDSKVGAQWVHRVAKDLRAGKVTKVIARLRKLKTKTEAEQKNLEGLIKYYTDNESRMHYDQYLLKGYGIGSGAVESAHKQVVHARMRQAGMRWSELGAQRLLALRVLLLNEQWSLLDRLTMGSLAA